MMLPCSMRCPVLTSRMLLPDCHAKSLSQRRYPPTTSYAMSATDLGHTTIVWYATCGTDLSYATTTWYATCSTDQSYADSVRYAMCSTYLYYAATRYYQPSAGAQAKPGTILRDFSTGKANVYWERLGLKGSVLFNYLINKVRLQL
eukprot:3859665-Rhodomonas_salina.2